MGTLPSIGIIGSGNVAWHLVQLFSAIPCSIHWYARRINEIENAEQEQKNILVYDLNKVSFIQHDFVFLAINDDAIALLPHSLFHASVHLIHCSGAKPLSTLAHFNTLKYSVFYPFQTFTKHRPIQWQSIPVFITSNVQEADQEIQNLCTSLNMIPQTITNEQRLKVHLVGVLANNFTYHLLVEGQKILEQEGLSKEVLKPILEETFDKFFHIKNTALGQSGPARRGDLTTQAEHVKLLNDQLALQEIYLKISSSIAHGYEHGTTLE
jgi:predicted short-subunit dehydrogenase-like oxidoreductase (DUF2520 family)